MSWLSKLFGGGDAAAPAPAESTEYNGYTITPAPRKEGGQWRLAATVEKDGKSHNLIRADLLESRDAAAQASVAKAKQMIDQQGDAIF